MKTGDRWTFPKPAPNVPPGANSQSGGENILLTAEAAEIVEIALEQLADFPNPIRGAILLSGDIGVDKLQLLHQLANLLANPETHMWNTLLETLDLTKEARPKAAIKSQFVKVPGDPSQDLSSFLISCFAQHSPSLALPAAGARITPDEFSALLLSISERMAEQSVGMVVLDSISERIEQLNDPEKSQHELRLYHILSDAFSQYGILAMLVGKEEHFSPMENGEEFESHHTWIEPQNVPAEKPAKNLPQQEEEFPAQLQLLIYDWIQSEIPSWKPEHSPRYQRDSQALIAAIPEGGKPATGMVYFKSIFDPHWSDEDISRLNRAAYPWVLMILSPLEFFYEFDSRLKEIVSKLPMLIIWHPDAPTKTELESLRSLAHEIAAHEAESDPLAVEALKKARPILGNLYINRGRLLGPSFQRMISGEIASLSIGQYLSACLSRLPQEKGAVSQGKPFSSDPGNQFRSLEWAAIITDRPELRTKSLDHVQAALINWWAQSVEGLSKKLPDFPEPFRTTRFRREIRFIEGPLMALKSALDSLRAGESGFFEAMEHLGRNFAWDQERLLRWKKGLESLSALALWLPAFLHARDYLVTAFPLGREEIDKGRESLLHSMDESYRFLEAQARSGFDAKFLEFKKSYMDAYYFLHEDALHIVSGLKKDEIKVDSESLRNLDLLSGLQYTDKSFLNRVKLLAKWVQRNQCNLPVRQILERYPRCYCNFNPCSQQQPADSAAQINGIIQDGIEYYRNLLRGFGPMIMVELKELEADDNALQPITALLSDGPMMPLKAQTIKLLNRVISKYPNDFLAELRKR
jgi:hypothetical protein